MLGMVGKVQEWAAVNGVEVTTRHSREIKRHALGKGKGSKEAMILAAERKWDVDVEDDNQADALWLLSLVQEELEG